jgi:hypothetical protein
MPETNSLTNKKNQQLLKQKQLARDIASEIRSFGVNDQVLRFLVAELALDLENVTLGKLLREAVEEHGDFRLVEKETNSTEPNETPDLEY